MRSCIVYGRGTLEAVKRYLPDNYGVAIGAQSGETGRVVALVSGEEVAGWTLEDYVCPRLGSGLYFAKPVEDPNAALDAALPYLSGSSVYL